MGYIKTFLKRRRQEQKAIVSFHTAFCLVVCGKLGYEYSLDYYMSIFLVIRIKFPVFYFIYICYIKRITTLITIILPVPEFK
jgi:hypothetical protein